jgi:hypothetical protein
LGNAGKIGYTGLDVGCRTVKLVVALRLDEDMGVACGPRYSLIRLQALGARPVSVSIANAVYGVIKVILISLYRYRSYSPKSETFEQLFNTTQKVSSYIRQ